MSFHINITSRCISRCNVNIEDDAYDEVKSFLFELEINPYLGQIL